MIHYVHQMILVDKALKELTITTSWLQRTNNLGKTLELITYHEQRMFLHYYPFFKLLNKSWTPLLRNLSLLCQELMFPLASDSNLWILCTFLQRKFLATQEEKKCAGMEKNVIQFINIVILSSIVMTTVMRKF